MAASVTSTLRKVACSISFLALLASTNGGSAPYFWPWCSMLSSVVTKGPERVTIVSNFFEEEVYSGESHVDLVSHAFKEKAPLLSSKSKDDGKHKEIHKADSFYSERDATPVFAEPNWWIFFSTCLFSITLLSIWQNAGKVAMSIQLDSGTEVLDFCALST